MGRLEWRKMIQDKLESKTMILDMMELTTTTPGKMGWMKSPGMMERRKKQDR